MKLFELKRFFVVTLLMCLSISQGWAEKKTVTLSAADFSYANDDVKTEVKWEKEGVTFKLSGSSLTYRNNNNGKYWKLTPDATYTLTWSAPQGINVTVSESVFKNSYTRDVKNLAYPSESSITFMASNPKTTVENAKYSNSATSWEETLLQPQSEVTDGENLTIKPGPASKSRRGLVASYRTDFSYYLQSITLTINKTYTYSATVNVTANPAAGGTVNGTAKKNITNSNNSSENITFPLSVTSENAGYFFFGWYDGENLLSTSKQYDYVMQASYGADNTKNIVAKFRQVADIVEIADPSDDCLLPSTEFTPEKPWEALTWVKVSENGYGNGNANNPNYGTILGPPSVNDNKNWYDKDYQVDDKWEVHTSAFADGGNYAWAPDGKFGDIYFRRQFKVNGKLPSELYLAAGHDDGPSEYYLNGELIWKETRTGKDTQNAEHGAWFEGEVVKLTEAQKKLIMTDGSVNVLAVHVHQNWGGYRADVGLYQGGDPKTNYDASRTPVDAKLAELEPYAQYLANNAKYTPALTSQSIRDNNDALAELNKIKVATLDETSTDNAIETTTYDAIVVKRSFWPNEWNTFCVPFKMTKEALRGALKDSEAEVAELVDFDIDKKKLKFAGIENDIDAGTPYLVWVDDVKKDGKAFDVELTAENVTIGKAGKTSIEITNNDPVEFQGTFDYTDPVPMGESYYIISSNKFYCVNSKVKLKGFRGYFIVPGGLLNDALSASFDDDDVTGITSVNENEYGDNNLYNIAGMRVNENAKGIIIKNGKKYIVK